jgi:hypothetical protein
MKELLKFRSSCNAKLERTELCQNLLVKKITSSFKFIMIPGKIKYDLIFSNPCKLGLFSVIRLRFILEQMLNLIVPPITL